MHVTCVRWMDHFSMSLETKCQSSCHKITTEIARQRNNTAFYTHCVHRKKKYCTVVVVLFFCLILMTVTNLGPIVIGAACVLFLYLKCIQYWKVQIKPSYVYRLIDIFILRKSGENNCQPNKKENVKKKNIWNKTRTLLHSNRFFKWQLAMLSISK